MNQSVTSWLYYDLKCKITYYVVGISFFPIDVERFLEALIKGACERELTHALTLFDEGGFKR